MDKRIRRMVAYAAAGRGKGKFGTSIFSYAESEHTNMSSSYDHRDSNLFSGADKGNMYHHGLRSHVQLNVEGNSFTGFDHSSGSHFRGKINGAAVQIYDFGEGCYFNYSV